MSAVDQGRVGLLQGGDGSIQPLRLARTGALVTTDAHARFQEAVLRGNVYYVSVSAATPTAYAGAAAGTPLLAIYNPTGTPKVLVPLAVGIANDAAASAAGVVAFKLWNGAPVVQGTGTKTVPTNALTQAGSGSVAAAYVNTVLTGQTGALSLSLPVASYYWATAASAFFAAELFMIEGLAPVIPTQQLALGATAALTSATWSAALYWEEVPYP
jgi:hypothetical protein